MANKKIHYPLKTYRHRTLTQRPKIVESATHWVHKLRVNPTSTERSLYVSFVRLTNTKKTLANNFEMRTHKRLIDIVNPTQKTVDALMKLDLQVAL